MKVLTPHVRLFALLLTASLGCGCGSSPKGYDSPQAAFDAFNEASYAREWGTMYDCLTPPSQQEKVAVTLVRYKIAKDRVASLNKFAREHPAYSSKLSDVIADAKREYETLSKLLSDHDVRSEELPDKIDMLADDWPQTYPKYASLVPRSRDFFIDHLERTKKLKGPPEPSERAALENLHVDGDIARGEVPSGNIVHMIFGPTQVEFRRNERGWFMHTADLERQKLVAKVREMQEDLEARTK